MNLGPFQMLYRPKHAMVIYICKLEQSIFTGAFVFFFTLRRFVLLAINSDEISVHNVMIFLLINCHQNVIDVLVEAIMYQEQ